MTAAALPLRAGMVLLAAGSLVLLVRSFDAPAALAPLLLALFAVPVLARPGLAVHAGLFLLYLNVPVIAHRFYGVPQALAASVVLLLALPLIGILVVRREPIRTGPVFHLMLGFLGVLLLSALFAPEAGIAFGRILGFATEGLLLYWLVVNVVRTELVLRRAIWAVLLAGSVAGGLSVYQAATGNHRNFFGGLAQHDTRYEFVASGEPGQEPRLQLKVSERAAGPIGEPNRYSQVLLVLIPLAAVYTRRARSRAAFALALACLGLLLAGVLLSQSRAALLTLALLAGVGLYLRWLRPAQLAVLGVVVLLVALRFAPGLTERAASLGGVLDLFRDHPSREADGAIRGRATEMLAAFHAFIDHPLIGVGPGQYLPVYSVQYQQDLPVKYRDLDTPRRAHNLYLEMAAETGLLGLLSFLGIMAALARQLRWARRRWAGPDPERADLATAFLLSLGTYLVSGMFLHLAFERYLWLLLALAGAALYTVWTAPEPEAELERELWSHPWLWEQPQAPGGPTPARRLHAARMPDEQQ